MYRSADEFVKDEMKQKSSSLMRMATVSALQDGKPKLTFYGEESESLKTYAYLDSYVPAAGDTVCLANINGTWLILGKIVR